MQNAGAPTTVMIRGTDFSWSLHLRDLWTHRELLYFLTWRDINVRYRQTVLGVAWAVIQPLAIALSLSLFLGHLVKVPSEGSPYLLFAYSAMVIWQLFANAVTESSNSLLVNERLITKVYFPRLILPLSAVLASLLDFVISLFILAFLLIYDRIVPTATIAILPFVVLLAVLIALGVGLWLGALNVKYRDVRYTIGFLVQFGFLTTPIAYSSNVVPERWRAWYGLNPMVGVVEGFRWALGGVGAPPLRLLAVSVCITTVIFTSGLYYFHRSEDTFADVI